MNFPRPGKIIRPLFGSSLGFVGLDGQKAYVMNFAQGYQEASSRLACLGTDVAGAAAERPPQ